MTVALDKAPGHIVVVITDGLQLTKTIADVTTHLDLRILTFADPGLGTSYALREKAEIVVIDMNVPQINGMEVLETLVSQNPSIHVYLLSDEFGNDVAVQATRRGATECLLKSSTLETLHNAICSRVHELETRQESNRPPPLLGDSLFCGMAARSTIMLDLFALIRKVAPHFHSVLVTGATGTGKELVARALCDLSPSASGRFVSCNCGALTDSLIETQLFGYVKGAFTGAQQDTLGLFEFANHGTLFLDEVGELPLALQPKLLRVLQNHELQRVGSPVVRPIELKIIAATNRNLAQMVERHEFREDLYYRLAMVELKVPLLRDRSEDLALLTRTFVEQFSDEYHKPIRGITPRAQALLSRHSWPGNVRELENVIGNACMMATLPLIDIEDLPSLLRFPNKRPLAMDFPKLEEVQKNHILAVLQHADGNKQAAADILGIARATLYRYLHDYRNMPNPRSDSK